MSKIYIVAGFTRWGTIRQIAMLSGLSINESKGWLKRTFVLEGSAVQIVEFADALFEKFGCPTINI